MMSPLLDQEHHEIMYKAMVALNNANPAKIVANIDNLHEEPGEGYVSHVDKKGQREEESLREFIGYVKSASSVEEALEDEAQEFISTLDGLPRLNDQLSEEKDVRFEGSPGEAHRPYLSEYRDYLFRR